MATKKTRSPKIDRRLVPAAEAERCQRRLERASLHLQDSIELLTDALLEKPKRVNLTALRAKMEGARAQLTALDAMLDEVK